jgi:hypothetical protein
MTAAQFSFPILHRGDMHQRYFSTGSEMVYRLFGKPDLARFTAFEDE